MESGVLELRSGHWPPATSAMTAWLKLAALPPETPPLAGECPRVVLLGDPPSALDSLRFAYALGILNVGRIGASAVVPRGAARLDRTLRHIRAGGYVRRLEVLEGSPLAQLRSFSLGICVPADEDQAAAAPLFGTRIAVRAALDAGTPVIVPDSSWAREVLPIGSHVCIAPSAESSALARTACRLLAEGGLEMARAALARAQPDGTRDLTRDIIEAWGFADPLRAATLGEPKPAGAVAGSA
jgi:hypothetical protein